MQNVYTPEILGHVRMSVTLVANVEVVHLDQRL